MKRADLQLDAWFPETVVRKAEDDTPRKGSKYGIIPITVATGVVDVTPKPSVPLPPPTGRESGKPFFTPGGTLVIPRDALPRYRWWAGGISLAAVIAETSGLACPVDFTDPLK